MFKLLIATLMFFGLASAPAIVTEPIASAPTARLVNATTATPVKSNNEKLKGIRRVYCTDGKDAWFGTIVHVASKRYLTVNHVSGGGTCFDTETTIPLKVIHAEPENDFAILSAPIDFDSTIFKLSCEPFIAGKTYHAIGWAKGKYLTNVDIRATTKYTDAFFLVGNSIDEHMRIFVGTIIPGMSGGVIFDNKWVIHGMNNAAWDEINRSYSRELADTAVCK